MPPVVLDLTLAQLDTGFGALDAVGAPLIIATSAPPTLAGLVLAATAADALAATATAELLALATPPLAKSGFVAPATADPAVTRAAAAAPEPA